MYNILEDNLDQMNLDGPSLVTFGEVMIRETPADLERPERTRLVHLSMAGSEFTLAIGVSRLGILSAYVTRLPSNPYGYAIRNVAREQGVDITNIVWASGTEPIGRLIYEVGRTPRRDSGIYQRMYSAASKLNEGMVDWNSTLRNSKIFHTSGITFGLSSHSNYDQNYLFNAFLEAISNKPRDCNVGLDFNYRSTLWSPRRAKEVMTPILNDHVDILITTIEDMAQIYNLGCGQYSAKEIINGDIGEIQDDDIRSFAEEVLGLFNLKIIAITIRYPDSFEQHRWESAAVNSEGSFFRSPAVKKITLQDRLGGGDSWNAGFYYGLLTNNFSSDSLEKGIVVGDAVTRIKQTLMFDLPLVDKKEIQALLKADITGGGKRTSR